MQWALYICLHICLSIYVYIFMLWHKIVFISVLEYSLNNHLWRLWQAVDAGFFFFCKHPDRELFQEDGSVNRVRLWCDTHSVLSFACQKTDKLRRLGTAREFSGCHRRSAWTLFCTSKQVRLIKCRSVWEIKKNKPECVWGSLRTSVCGVDILLLSREQNSDPNRSRFSVLILNSCLDTWTVT